MEENQSILELQVDQTASKNLSDATRWAKFLSITGFICMGLVVIFFILMQAQIARALSQVVPGLSDIDSLGMLISVIIIAAGIVCLLMYFLFRGSLLVKRGIEFKNQEIFNNGLASFKSYFIMYGILGLISLLMSIVRVF